MEAFKIDLSNDSTVNESAMVHMSLSEWTTMDKTSLAKRFPIFSVDDDRPIESIIRPPNAEDGNIRSVLERVNSGRMVPPSVRQVPWGWLVGVGELMVLVDNGQVYAVGPGRYSIKFWRRIYAKWGRKESMQKDHFTDQAFTFVRVQRGKLGLAMENGKPVLLQEGLHVYNNPLFSFSSFVSVDEEHVRHGSYHVLRVPRGSFGMITEQARAKLLPEGTHAVDNPVFEYKGLVNTIEAYINHGSIHIIQVPKGHVGLVLESKNPRLLHEGVHVYDSPTLKFVEVKSKLEPVIQHGTITRFLVQKGEVALAWLNNEPVLIEEAASYQVDSSNFRLVKVQKVNDKNIALGAKKIVTVFAGEVGVSFKGGSLAVLPPGRHYIESADHIFEGFLSTQQLSLKLSTDRDLLVCETKDLVSIGIKADVFYRISDPVQAIMEVGREFIPELVKETSIATLNNIIRSTALNEIAQSSNPSAVSEREQQQDLQSRQATGAPSAPLFFDKAHDQFLAKLHDDFKARYGLEITNIRIEQFKIRDPSLSQSISGQAVKTAETQSELANLQGKMQIATQEQERESRMSQIKAEAQARSLQTKADSEKAQAEAMAAAQRVRTEMEAATKRTQAEAEADAVRTKAQAEADAVKIQAEAIISRAKAEAEAISLKAQAEANRAKMLAATPLGEKLSLLEVYAGMVKSSNEGVNKVVYVDPTTTQAGNPLSLLTLQSLQKDLAQLGSSAE
mmetsp:Transcript_68680/g.159250  ORF Transcript_68680/g.159250 Transcript_68680/m.159250 type:complete len:732 (-) Transcript_68680:133-2328(-)